MAMLIKNENPNGWVTAKIKDIVSLQNGYAFKPQQWSDTGIPIIRIQNLNNPEKPFNYCNEDIDIKFEICPQDLLFAWSGTPGTSFGAHIWNGDKAWLNQHIYRVDSNYSLIDKIFLKYAINQNLDDYINQAHGGAGLAHITKKKFEVSEVMLPPLNEQKRIADKLEILLTRVDKARERLANVPKIMKRFRQAILSAACSGKLTEDWREKNPDVETSEELLNKIFKKKREKWEEEQKAKFKLKNNFPKNDDWKKKYHEINLSRTAQLFEIPANWCWGTLDLISEVKGGITKGQKRKTSQVLKTVPYLRVANVQRGFLDLNEIKEIEATDEEINDLKLFKNDLLFTEGGDRDKLGRGWIWNDEIELCIHQNHIFRGRLLNKNVQAKFISWFCNYFGQQYFSDFGKQSTNLASINITQLKKFPVPLPPIKEQKEIVSRIEKQLKLADLIEARLRTARGQVEKLTQSILSKAFRGELVPTEAELAQLEGRDYETAEQLLERIKETDIVQPKPSNTKRKKVNI